MKRLMLLALIATTISLSETAAQETRLLVSPGLTADRLEVKDPAGRIQYYVERTMTGRLVIKKPDGSVVGNFAGHAYDSVREEEREERPRKYLTLPESWNK